MRTMALHNIVDVSRLVHFETAEPLHVCIVHTTINISLIIITRHTLVWQGTICLLFFSLPGYRYLGDGGTDRREILHDGTSVSDRSSPLLGAVPQRIPKSEILGLNFGHLTANVSKRQVTYQLELNITSTRHF